MAKFKLKEDYRPYRLVLKDKGPHRFGGPATHNWRHSDRHPKLLCTTFFPSICLMPTARSGQIVQ